jgi:hypothetical protein
MRPILRATIFLSLLAAPVAGFALLLMHLARGGNQMGDERGGSLDRAVRLRALLRAGGTDERAA